MNPRTMKTKMPPRTALQSKGMTSRENATMALESIASSLTATAKWPASPIQVTLTKKKDQAEDHKVQEATEPSVKQAVKTGKSSSSVPEAVDGPYISHMTVSIESVLTDFNSRAAPSGAFTLVSMHNAKGNLIALSELP